MKVKTLIKCLQNFNPNAIVRMGSYYGGEVLFALGCKNHDDAIWLEGPCDCDLSNEIKARYDAVLAGELTEFDFYFGLAEAGIGPDLLRKVCGEDEAKAMELFCKEHGIEY